MGGVEGDGLRVWLRVGDAILGTPSPSLARVKDNRGVKPLLRVGCSLSLHCGRRERRPYKG